MAEFKLVRLVRTPSSEVYLLWEEGSRVGQVDIHYAESIVHATIVLERDVNEEQLEGIITQLDNDVVSSYLPDFEREDLFVNVYRGEEIMSYSEDDDDDDEPDLDA